MKHLLGTTPQDKQAKILLLGMYHFTKFNNFVDTDHLPVPGSDGFEEEVTALVNDLSEFKPTKICVAVTPPGGSMNSAYRKYVQGEHTLAAYEHEQIGFQLAKKLGHQQLYPIYFMNKTPFQPVIEYHPEFEEWFNKQLAHLATRQKRFSGAPLRKVLLAINSDDEVMREHELYLRLGAVGGMEADVGPKLLTAWFERNIRIYANIVHHATPGERLLVMLSSGHLPIIRSLLSDAGLFKLVPSQLYLSPLEIGAPGN